MGPTRVKPRPPYSPPPKPAKEKKLTLQRKKRPRAMSNKARRESRAHDQIHDNFMATNSVCCICGDPAEERHHICRGTFAKDASRYDTDTQLGTCGWCHEANLGDAEVYPVARQIAIKLVTIIRKVNRYRGRGPKAITAKDILPYLDLEE